MLLLFGQNSFVLLTVPTDRIRRDYCISLYATMTILPADVILMTRHNGRIDGDTSTNMVGQREL